MRKDCYVKDSEKRMFIACKLTHVIGRCVALINRDTKRWYCYEMTGYQSYGVTAADPNAEICLSHQTLYAEPNGEAEHDTCCFIDSNDLDILKEAISRYPTQYWRWDDTAAKAVQCKQAYLAYDHLTGEVILAEDLAGRGYIYASKEEAEAANAYAVMEFSSVKKAKTYIIRETVEETYEVEASSMKEATALFNEGKAKKNNRHYTSKTELKKADK